MTKNLTNTKSSSQSMLSFMSHLQENSDTVDVVQEQSDLSYMTA